MKRVAVEIEAPMVNSSSYEAVERDVTNSIWNKIGGKRYYDDLTKEILGVEMPSGCRVGTDASISTLEIASAIYTDIHQLNNEISSTLRAVQSIIKPDSNLLGLSTQPLTSNSEPEYWKRVAPRDIYPILRDQCGLKHRALLNTAAYQPCIDANIETAGKELYIVHAIEPFLVALFGNSPLTEGKLNGWKEYRYISWDDYISTSKRKEWDKKTVHFSPEPIKTLSDWFKHLWDNPMLFLPYNEKDSKEFAVLFSPEISGLDRIDISMNPTFIEFLKTPEWYVSLFPSGDKKLMNSSSKYINYTTTWTFLDRLRLTLDTNRIEPKAMIDAIEHDTVEKYLLAQKAAISAYLEVRSIGAQPFSDAMSPVAFVLGLLENIGQSYRFMDGVVNRIGWTNLTNLGYETARRGLDVEEVPKILSNLLELSEIGLKTRGLSEELYLNPLKTRVSKKRNPADEVIRVFEKDGLEGVFKQRRWGD